MKRSNDSYLWFDHRTNRGHQNAMLNVISDEDHLANKTKEGIKWPSTTKSLMYLGDRK